jgi:hypothetical protein
MNTGKKILDASKKVLAEKRSMRIFLLASAVIFTLLYMIPVWTTPGNDIAFHFSILPKPIFALMVVLALANGLLIAMQFFVRGHKKQLKDVAKESATFVGIIGSALAATIACAACYSSLLAFLGLGASVFIVEHQFYFALAAILLTLVALHYTSKRVLGACDACQIKL